MTGEFIEINGERIPKSEVADCIKMLLHDAKEYAGQFHNQNRSEKFRLNWPSEYVFADANWQYFIDATRRLYAELLGNEKVKPRDKRRMHIALVGHSMATKDAPLNPRSPIMPGTQQFEGDKFENKKIIDKFGPRSNTFKELLMSSASRRFDA